MNDCIIKPSEIFLQNIICNEVIKNPNRSNIDIYNALASRMDVSCIEDVERILTLIKMNKMALTRDLA